MLDKTAYREFCQQQAYWLPVFMQPWYLDAVAEGGDWDAVVYDKKGRLLAAWPFFLKKKGPFHYSTLPPFTKFLGPCLAPEARALKDQHRILTTMEAQLPSLHAIKCTTPYSFTNWLPLYWRGYQQRTQYSYHIPLKDWSAVEAGINRNMRRNIRKAQAALQVVASEDIDFFYQLNQMSFDRQQVAMPYALVALRRHDQALRERNRRKIFLARDADGQVHSAAYLIWDQQRSYYHLSGDNPRLRQSGAGMLLIYHAMVYTAEELRLPTFDFEGSMIERIEAIRRQFGAIQQPYFFIWKYRSRLFQAAEALRQWRK